MHVGHLLTRAARRWPDRPAWRQGDLTVAFREAEARVNRLAHALLAGGARPGDRIGMLVPNCYQGIETMLAPMKAGMGVVPMNVRLHPDEHAFMLQDSGAGVLRPAPRPGRVARVRAGALQCPPRERGR